MRTVYLIRHGMPDFPGGERMCLGTTDLPLSPLGRLQAARAAFALRSEPISAVFSSTLGRAVESAAAFGLPVTELEGLREMDAGEWDGLSFAEIRALWPELYEKRGSNALIDPPGAEKRERALMRFKSAVETALAASSGDIAVVAHRSVERLFIESEAGAPREQSLPYGSITTLAYSEGSFRAADIGAEPHPEPDESFCRAMLAALDTPESIIGHCFAVARRAMDIICALAAGGLVLDENLVYAAAALHDAARREPDHPAVAAGWLRELGYPEIAEVIAPHHDWSGGEIDEAAVLFIADKLVSGDKPVTLEGRFAASRSNCGTPEALEAHEKRYAAARDAARRINLICGKEIMI